MSFNSHPQIPPLNAFQVVGRTFSIYARQFIAFFLLTAIVVVPVAMFSQAFSSRFTIQLTQQLNAMGINATMLNGFNQNNPQAMQAFSDQITQIAKNNPQAAAQLLSTFGGFVVLLLAISLISALVNGVIINGALTYLVAERSFGKILPMEKGFGQSSRHWFTLTLSWIFFYLLLLVMIIALVIILAVLSIVPCLLLLAIPIYFVGFGLLFYMSLTISAFLTPVAALESIGPLGALGRAWRLGKAHFWSIAGVKLIIGIIGFVIGYVIGFIAIRDTAASTTTALITAIVASLTSPLGVISNTVLYVDARVRYDTLNEDLAHQENPDARLSDLNSRPSQDPLIGGSDWMNMFILAVLVIAVVIIFGAVASRSGLVNLPTSGFGPTSMLFTALTGIG